MLEREHRVGGAVDDERRGGDRRQRLRRSFAVGHEIVVLDRGEVSRPLNVAADELTDSGLVEYPLATRKELRVRDQVVADGSGVRPIGLGRGDEATELWRRRRQVVIAAGCAEVLIRVRESTRSAESSATSWAIPPPAEAPTRCAAEMLNPSSTRAASAVRSAPVYPGRPGS
jgi:hypothetical protein